MAELITSDVAKWQTLEETGDIASMFPTPWTSIGGALASLIGGIGKNIALYNEGTITGDEAFKQSLSRLLWSGASAIPGVGAASKAARLGKFGSTVSKATRFGEKGKQPIKKLAGEAVLAKRTMTTQKAAAAATDATEDVKNAATEAEKIYKGARRKAITGIEELKAVRKGTVASTDNGALGRLIKTSNYVAEHPWKVAGGLAATSFGINYGVDGAVESAENGHGILYTPYYIGKNILDDAELSSYNDAAYDRLYQTFALPFMYRVGKKSSSPAAKAAKKAEKAKKAAASKRTGGKLNYINFLRYANNT